ncbi:hypothetical protein [Blastococcus tunisiensis]|uniref:Uncharacterized protein n=1 Tax=Blastococcus tunisiensis TaxID=1798228 RepID=A0A1I2JGA8_9ACTN|nr:hypothetical protein [Blastococcus sp. DSM 46838]SFF52893.1 hypothetical protein SAMN05216574_1163 [Blastococcus sp. DSM 46838]
MKPIVRTALTMDADGRVVEVPNDVMPTTEELVIEVKALIADLRQRLTPRPATDNEPKLLLFDTREGGFRPLD